LPARFDSKKQLAIHTSAPPFFAPVSCVLNIDDSKDRRRFYP
jgi:hypothetical protein